MPITHYGSPLLYKVVSKPFKYYKFKWLTFTYLKRSEPLLNSKVAACILKPRHWFALRIYLLSTQCELTTSIRDDCLHIYIYNVRYKLVGDDITS